MEDLKVVKKRGRDEYEPAGLDDSSDSVEVKRLRENLLNSLDDEADFCTASHDLDSFMKSFEEEIGGGGAAVESAEVVYLTSDCGESRPDLGYLLEASDDELGLPPTTSSPVLLGNELDRVESGSSEFGGGFWEIPSYDSFGLGFGVAESSYSEYVALDGLFDYSDLGVGSGDFAYRPETLPAQ